MPPFAFSSLLSLGSMGVSKGLAGFSRLSVAILMVGCDSDVKALPIEGDCRQEVKRDGEKGNQTPYMYLSNLSRSEPAYHTSRSQAEHT